MRLLIGILSLICLIGITNLVMADEIELNLEEQTQQPIVEEGPAPIILAPKWEEFCEPGYESVQVSDKKDLLNILTFVKSERTKRSYWADRRVSFEKYLNRCKAIVDDNDRGACFTELRHIENNKNEVYNSQRKQILYQNDIIIKDASK